MGKIKIKRIYEQSSADDGYRVLVDRLWPRGVSKKDANLDEWNKEIAPSTELRKWFDHKEERFDEFACRYREELNEKKKAPGDIFEKIEEKKAVKSYDNQLRAAIDVIKALKVYK